MIVALTHINAEVQESERDHERIQHRKHQQYVNDQKVIWKPILGRVNWKKYTEGVTTYSNN